MFFLLALLATVQADTIYSRTQEEYTIQSGGNAWNIAYKVYSDKDDTFYNQVAREIGLINNIDPYGSLSVGVKVLYPVYRESKRKFCGDLRNWKYAVEAGYKYEKKISPALLIAIRTHENPKRSRDHYAYGVTRYKYTDLQTQARMAARALGRYNVSWNPMNPTREELYRVGRIYCPTGPIHWAREVYKIRKWALGE